MEQFGFMVHLHFWVCSRWDYLCFLIAWQFSKILGILKFWFDSKCWKINATFKIMSQPPNHNFLNLNTNLNLNFSHDNVGTTFLLRVLRAWVGCGNLLKLEHSYVRWKKTINYNTQWKMVDQILWLVVWQCNLEIMVMQVHGNYV